ncbi:class C beta-lactamase-related serine hydrolase [Hwanghaeella grinnelliae]|uniref:Class C beta-lactamase-related serine hydrolase n=2 Tax=Hwanghaeella grinnelliae TaxID=2500179 RepID=A0A437QZ45_9PROT|nr:class C beta-lactamase-related serine hydrolase [Hwanghaeella grinnelliae]
MTAALTNAPGSALADTLDQKLRAGFKNGELPGLHGAVIDLGKRRLAEIYFPGKDERWGSPIGERQHGPDTLHDLRSVTKSVVGLLYGIALAEGKVPAPSEPLYAQFPDYPDLMAEPGRDRILVAHALSMQMGLEWNEDLPYSDPRNSEIGMERASDRYRYVLEQPIREAPGQSWIYSGGAVALLGRLIEIGTGMSLDAYARHTLFEPLGISHFEWVRGADGTPSAASGLRLTLPDLAKIGHLVAQDGRYDGKQVVPKAWIEESVTPRADVTEGTRYGYLWYIAGRPKAPLAIAVGNGGQRLTVQPEHDFVVAAFVGRYNDPLSWQTSLKVTLDYAAPAAKALLSRQQP